MSKHSQSADEIEVARRVKEMREADIVDLLRDTVTHLNVLADRLDHLADQPTFYPTGEDTGA